MGRGKRECREGKEGTWGGEGGNVGRGKRECREGKERT